MMLSRNVIAVVLAFSAFSIAVVLGPRSVEAQVAESEVTTGLTSLDSLLSIPVSTASKYEQAQSEVPASVSIITSEDIARYGWRTLTEALASLPGFYGTYDRLYEQLGTRGFSRPSDYNNRFLLLIDGHAYNDNFYDAAATGTDLALSLQMVDRIEVVRGPGSSMYGNSAMFGVINVVPKAGSSVQGGEIIVSGGSYGTFEASSVVGKRFSPQTELMISATLTGANGQDLYYSEFDDPDSNFGVAEGLDDERQYGFFGTFRWNSLSFQGSAARRTKSVPTAHWETMFNEANEQTDERWWAELRYGREWGGDKEILVRGFADYYGFDGQYPYEDELEIEQNRSNWYGTEVQFRWDPVPVNRIKAGAEYRYSSRAYYGLGTEQWWFEFDNDFSVASLYVQNELQVTSTLALTLGLRGDHYSTTGSSLTPRGAAVFHPLDGTAFKLLYGEGYRAPNQNEFNYEEEDFWVKNPDIRPENVRTLEFVWQQRITEGVFGNVSLFHYEVDDLIDVAEDEETELGFYDNLESVTANGVEVELVARTRSRLSAFGNYSFHNAVDGDDLELTNSPAHLARLGVSIPVVQQTYLSMEARYESARVTPKDTRTDDFAVFNLTLFSHDLPGRLRGSVSLRNVFDAEYENPGGWEHEQASISQNGRHLLIMLGVDF